MNDCCITIIYALGIRWRHNEVKELKRIFVFSIEESI